MKRSRLPRGLAPLLTTVLCLGTAQLARLLVDTDLAPALFWPPAGIALGAALGWGLGTLPGAVAGVLLAALGWGLPWTSAALLAGATGVQALAGVLLLSRSGFSGSLSRLADLLRLLVFGGLIPGLLAAALAYPALAGVDWFWEGTSLRGGLALVAAMGLGTLIFAPILFCRRSPECPPASGAAWESALALLGLIVTALILAHPTALGMPAAAFRPYPLMPFLLWLALRADPRLTGLGIGLVHAVAASAPGWGRGNLFAQLPDAMLLPMHGFVAALALVFMVLAVLMVARTRVEAALRSSETRFRNVVELTRNCLWEMDVERRFSYLDHHAEAVFRMPAEALLGRSPDVVWSTALRPPFRCLLDGALEGGEALTRTATLTLSGGEVVYLEISCVPRRDEAGHHLGWQGITRDVTERERLARDLEDSHRRFRQLAENIQEVFWVSEDMARFVYISPRCEDVLGLPREILFRDYLAWLRLVPDEDQAQAREALARLARRQSVDMEIRIRHPGKGQRWVQVRSFPFEENGGTPLNAGIMADVTDRRQAEESHMAETLAQRDALIREVHHRIKNNLQTVVSLLRREAGRHPEARESIEAAIAQVRTVAVVHGLHGRLTRHSIMLCELLPAVVDSVAELSRRPIRREGLPEGCGELRIMDNETVAMALILNELVTNAVKHGGEDGSAGEGVLVTMAREGHQARIRISNAGRLPEGFDFSRGLGLGTGLGLVRALQPSPGMDIRFSGEGESVLVEVVIDAPLLSPTAIDQLEFGTVSHEQNTDRR